MKMLAERREPRRRLTAFVAVGSLAVAAVLSGCSGTEERAIVNVFGSPSSTVLSVSIDSCNSDPSIEVLESEEEVRLTARIENSLSDEDDCRDSKEVRLDRALGSRVVVDGKTNRTLTVLPPD